MKSKLRHREGHKRSVGSLSGDFTWKSTDEGIFGMKLWDPHKDKVYVVLSTDGKQRPLCVGDPPSVCVFVDLDFAYGQAALDSGEVVECTFGDIDHWGKDNGAPLVLVFADGSLADVVLSGALEVGHGHDDDDDIPF